MLLYLDVASTHGDTYGIQINHIELIIQYIRKMTAHLHEHTLTSRCQRMLRRRINWPKCGLRERECILNCVRCSGLPSGD